MWRWFKLRIKYFILRENAVKDRNERSYEDDKRHFHIYGLSGSLIPQGSRPLSNYGISLWNVFLFILNFNLELSSKSFL